MDQKHNFVFLWSENKLIIYLIHNFYFQLPKQKHFHTFLCKCLIKKNIKIGKAYDGNHYSFIIFYHIIPAFKKNNNDK